MLRFIRVKNRRFGGFPGVRKHHGFLGVVRARYGMAGLRRVFFLKLKLLARIALCFYPKTNCTSSEKRL